MTAHFWNENSFLPSSFLSPWKANCSASFYKAKNVGDRSLVPFKQGDVWQSSLVNWDVKLGLPVEHTQQSVIYERRKCLCFISLSPRRYYEAITCCEWFGECFTRALLLLLLSTRYVAAPKKKRREAVTKRKLVLRDSLKYARLLLLSRFI